MKVRRNIVRSTQRRPSAKRAAFFRVLLIAHRIRAGEQVTQLGLAREQRCCEKTIGRDFEFLRDLGFPLFFDRKARAWTFNQRLPLPWWLGGSAAPPNSVRANYESEPDCLGPVIPTRRHPCPSVSIRG